MVITVLQTPYLGGKFSDDLRSRQIVVEEVFPEGPLDNAGILPGDRFVAVQNLRTSERLALTGFEALIGRHKMPTYDVFNAVQMSGSAFHAYQALDEFAFENENGGLIRIKPDKVRSIENIPPSTWLGLILSLTVTGIVVGVLAFAGRSTAIILLTLCGTFLVVVSAGNALWSAREITFAPIVAFVVPNIISLGLVLFIYTLLALIWHIPRPVSSFAFARTSICIACLTYILQVLQIFEFPLHTYQLPLLITFPIALIISAIQFWRVRDNSIERASLLWFNFSIYGTNSVIVLLFSIPVIGGFTPVIGLTTASFILCLIYVGFAFGTLRYRIFDVHHLWWRVVIWLAGGMFVVMIDFLLVSNFALTSSTALMLALLFTGWIYFPLRQYLFSRFIGSTQILLSDNVASLVDEFTHIKEPEDFDGRLIVFLRKLFDADEIGAGLAEPLRQARVLNKGLVLQIPSLTGRRAFNLIGRSRGLRLFSTEDAKTVDAFVSLVRNFRQARIQSDLRLNDERERIMRDLHDDVGGQILDIIYSSKDPAIADQARATVKTLKETMMVVENKQTVEGEIALNSIFDDTKARFERSGRSLNPRLSHKSKRILSAREFINLKRIIQEIGSNAIKHGSPDRAVILRANLRSGGSISIFCINTSNETSAQSHSGRGIANITKRLAEIGGNARFRTLHAKNGRSCFAVWATVPLHE